MFGKQNVTLEAVGDLGMECGKLQSEVRDNHEKLSQQVAQLTHLLANPNRRCCCERM